jgi:hypothetical protein
MNKWWISIIQLTICELGRIMVLTHDSLWCKYKEKDINILVIFVIMGKHLSTATIWRIQ